MRSTDRLLAYKKKRDFALTPEPAGAVAKNKSALSFVIQKHAARNLHYDFRLELDGTLKSWAIPKGPSLDPAQKRMAVHVEDHPLSYAEFEGVIPPKQYGAGTVIVWDRGSWQPVGDPRAGYRAGKLKFMLDGEKLQGGWTLVKMRGNANERHEPWLLIKERDAHARPANEFSAVDAMPDSVLKGTVSKRAAKRKIATRPTASNTAATPAHTARGRDKPRHAGGAAIAGALAGAKRAAVPLTLAPQLATLVDRVPAQGDWSYEIKYDGYRILARIDADDVRLFTRNGHDWSAKLGRLAAALRGLNLAAGWLDGEIVVLGAKGTPDFGALQNAFDAGRTEQIQYFVFDLPFYAGFDLRGVALSGRRALLASLLRDAHSDQVRFSDDFKAHGIDVLHNACRLGLEGVIGKRRDSEYVSRRTSSWIKLKCTRRQEFVVVGYTEPQGTRTGIGALLLGVHDAAGHLRYAGRVGTGFDTRTLTALKKRLSGLAVEKSPLHEKPTEARGRWVAPKLVAEVSFAEWTREDRVRHAVFQGLRADKPAAAITREAAAEVPGANAEVRASSRKRARASTKSGSPAIPGARITHRERIIDSSTGLTKLDLVNYYVLAAPRILSHLAKRPVSLLRAPAGVQGELFFQKHGDTLKIADLKELDAALDPGHPPLMEIDSVAALLGAAQMNAVEFHTWNATSRNIDKPDRMTFDLDPGEGLAWPRVREAAHLVRTFLDELGLKSFLKTSGGNGLHVVVPLTPRDDWDTVKDFSKSIVQHLASVVPARFVAKSGARNRVGKVFVDYLRNGRGATTVAAFSARARPGIGVSIPCSWDELPSLSGGAQWTIANAHERLASADDPWAEYSKTKQTLKAAMKKLVLR